MKNEENNQEYNHKKNKMNLVNDKIKIILPELMARNLKLGDRLKNKLKVSNFLNNTENRNQKYLKSFVTFSDKRVKDLKTGLELSKAIKQSSKNLSPLCSQITNDSILQNSNFLIEEKKLLNENTEQETHMKINDLIQNLKNTVKNTNLHPNKPIKKPIKSLSETELNNIKLFINNKILKEGNMINNKIKGYLEKLKNTAETDRKNFKSYVDRIDISDNLKFINYTKPKPFKIKDKECTSMIRIKKQIFPYIGSSYRKNNSRKIPKKKYLNLRNISNELDLNISNEINKNNNNSSFNDNGKNENQDKDTLKVLNNLADQGRNLPLKITKTVNKVNSLIDINLPTPSAYEKILKECKENSSKNNINTKNDFDEVKGDINDIVNMLKSPEPSFSKNNLKKIIKIFRKEIDIIKKEKLNFNKKEDEENIQEKYNLVNPLSLHINRIKKYNQKNDIIENLKNNSEKVLFKKKMDRFNSYHNKNNEGDSNIFNTIKIHNSSSINNNINDKNIMNKKEKLLKNRSYITYSNDSHLSLLTKCLSSKCNKDESINNYIDSCFNMS